MAERRMFAKSIIDSDAFLDMPMSARLLYYDLGMRADDDGFINSPKKIMRTIGATTDDMNILIARKFVIPFDTGVVVIKAWRINNYLRNDRYKKTNYQEEFSSLSVDEIGMYHSENELGIPSGIPVVDTDKDSIDKVSIDKNNNIYSRAISEIVDYLNKKTGKSFRSSSAETRKLIIGLLKQNYTVDDFKKVIDIKTDKWLKDVNMVDYLRPKTLFSNKFESYLNEKPIKQEEEKKDENGIPEDISRRIAQLKKQGYTDEQLKLVADFKPYLS